MENKTIHIKDKMVRLYNIIGTKTFVADAWQKLTPPIVNRDYRTITFDGKDWYGRIGTNLDKTKYEHLPPSTQERCNAVMAAYQEAYEEAYRLIFKVFPELETIPHKKDMGDITFVCPEN